jgi:hypothetical protein
VRHHPAPSARLAGCLELRLLRWVERSVRAKREISTVQLHRLAIGANERREEDIRHGEARSERGQWVGVGQRPCAKILGSCRVVEDRDAFLVEEAADCALSGVSSDHFVSLQQSACPVLGN